MSTLSRNIFAVHSSRCDCPECVLGGDVSAPAALWPAWTDAVRVGCDPGGECADDDLDHVMLDDPDGGNDEDGSGGFEPPTAERAWWSEQAGAPEGNPPQEPRLPFGAWIRVESSMIRLKGTGAAKWLAFEMDKLATLAELLDAQTPDQYDGRFLVMESGAREDLYHLGYTKGYDDGKSEALDLVDRR